MFKNCCKNKANKNIKVEIDIDPKNMELFDGVAISRSGVVSGHRNGELGPLVGNNMILFRKSGSARNKPLSGGVTFNDSLHIDPNSILAPFQHVLAVDTNTRNDIIDGHKISVSTLIHCVIEKVSPIDVSVQYSLVGAWEFWGLEDKTEEKHFWWYLIDTIENGVVDEIYKNGDIAILTDCDQARHVGFNKREQPVFKNYYLPDRYFIIYATSDVSRDLPNKLLRKCDRFSNSVMAVIKDEKYPEVVSGQSFTHFRRWIPNVEDESWKIEL